MSEFESFKKLLLKALDHEPNKRIAYLKSEQLKTDLSKTQFFDKICKGFHLYNSNANHGDISDLKTITILSQLLLKFGNEVQNELKSTAIKKLLDDFSKKYSTIQTDKVNRISETLIDVTYYGKKFTSGTDEYLHGLREKLAVGEIDKKTAIIELKSQVETASDYLEELKVYQKPLNRFKQYRDIILDCKEIRRALKKEIDFYENDILPESNSKLPNKQIQPIHWLKGDESLRQFLESIKKKGLIENRETDEIIQEHFYVDGQEPTKEPQPIKWQIESKYLAYLMHRLAEEFIINIKGRKHQLTASHFISSEGKKLKSLASQLSQILRHGKSTDMNLSTIENIIQKVKS